MLTDAKADLSAYIGERTQEGQYYRRVHDLALIRNRLPVFPLTWTLMHEIDHKSPLHGMDSTQLGDGKVRLFLAVEARDHALGAEVYDAKDYPASDIAFGMRYVDAVSVDAHGRTIADLDRLSVLEPDGGTSFPGGT
jgi:inward rectifier potassium channel